MVLIMSGIICSFFFEGGGAFLGVGGWVKKETPVKRLCKYTKRKSFVYGWVGQGEFRFEKY